MALALRLEAAICEMHKIITNNKALVLYLDTLYYVIIKSYLRCRVIAPNEF